MVFEASLSLPKSFSSDVSVLFFWSVAGQVDTALRVRCSPGCCSAGGSRGWVGGGSGPFVWASLRQTAVSLNISSVDTAGRCPGLALWSHSQRCGPSIEVWGAERG